MKIRPVIIFRFSRAEILPVAVSGCQMPDELKKVRQEIDYNFADFKKIIGSKKFKSVYGDLDRSAEFLLSRVPKGYEPDNPAAEYLKLKSFVAMILL